MKGKHKVIVYNNRLHYEFSIKRNITIIQGDSATGKTTLINMLRQAETLGPSSGVIVSADVPCRVLEGSSWKLILENTSGCIFFIDEENTFINTEEFAGIVNGSDNYFVLITRENLYNLPYSVDEIYGIKASGKYHNTKRVYEQLYNIYVNLSQIPVTPKKIITEDSNSGYEFFSHVGRLHGIECESADGKSNIIKKLKHSQDSEKACIIADGAAIGPEMNRLSEYVKRNNDTMLYLPESFEWLILKSGLIGGNDIKEILQSPESYIDSKEYLSWERYFTKLLTDKTAGTYLNYRKSELNKVYLHDNNAKAIMNEIKGIKL